MKAVASILSAILLFPIAILAQANASSPAESQTVVAGALQERSFPAAAAGDASAAQELNAKLVSGLVPDPEPNVSQQGGPARTANSSPNEKRRPTIDGSMVGYIDNAVIGSQVRVRFEAGFDDSKPDLAEFFYAKCGCYKNLGVAPSPTNQAIDPNAPGPGLGVPSSINFQQLYLYGEYAPDQRFSMFAEVPFRWLQPQGFLAVPPFPPFGNEAGISDVRAGVKLALLTSNKGYLTLQVTSYLPTGETSRGLGTGHYSVEPALLFYQALSRRFAWEGQLGDWHPIRGSAGVPTSNSEGFAGDVFFYGIGPSYEAYSSDRLSFVPVIELVGWRVLSGFETLPGGPVLGASADVSGTNIVNLKIGARTTIAGHNSIYVGYGRALTTADWYKSIVRLEYRRSF